MCVVGLSVFTVLLVYEACVLLACQCSLSYWCVKCVLACYFVIVYYSTGVVLLACQCSQSSWCLCCWPVSVHSPPGVCVVGLCSHCPTSVCVVGPSVFTLSYWCVLLAWCSHCHTDACCWPVSIQTGVCVGLSVFTLSYWCTCYWPACSHCPTGVCVLACWCSHCPTGV